MPLGPQPHGARGTVERPYSALRLRLVLAIFGLVVCCVGGVILWDVDARPFAWVLFAGAAVALIDMGVVLTRIQRGRSRLGR
jgi:Family of unknown function (DUF6343)